MTTSTMDPRAEIERRMTEFEQATRRAHARFFVGAMVLAVLVVTGFLYGLASWRL